MLSRGCGRRSRRDHGLVARVRLLRRPRRHARHRGGLPQPAPPRRAPAIRRARRRTFWAGLGAVRRDVFAAVGGFDAARYPHPSIEDIELGGRLAARGRILLDPAMQGTHLKEWTLRSMVTTDFVTARRPVGRADARARRAANGAEPRLARASERGGERRGARCALARRRRDVASALSVQIALNTDLYGLLGRRLGPRGVLAGVGLHVLHHAAGAAAVPAAVAGRFAAGR